MPQTPDQAEQQARAPGRPRGLQPREQEPTPAELLFQRPPRNRTRTSSTTRVLRKTAVVRTGALVLSASIEMAIATPTIPRGRTRAMATHEPPRAGGRSHRATAAVRLHPARARGSRRASAPAVATTLRIAPVVVAMLTQAAINPEPDRPRDREGQRDERRDRAPAHPPRRTPRPCDDRRGYRDVGAGEGSGGDGACARGSEDHLSRRPRQQEGALSDWVAFNSDLLGMHHLVATGTTGTIIERRLGLPVRKLEADHLAATSRSAR